MSVFMVRENKNIGDDPSDWPKDMPEMRVSHVHVGLGLDLYRV